MVKGRENEGVLSELLGDPNRIYQDAPIGLCYFDTDLRFQQINKWLAAINGLSVEDHLGRTIGELFPDVATGVEPQLRSVIETGEPIIGGTVEAETPAQPGVIRSFEHSYNAIKSDDGTVVGISCIVQDVTKRKQTAISLQESRETNLRLEALLEAAPDPTISMDPSGRIIGINEQAKLSFGYDRDELIDQDLEILVPDRFRGQHIQHRRAYSSNPTTRNMGTGLELTIRCKDGQELPVEISLKPIEIAGEQIVIAAIRDITWRKEAEAALNESTENLHVLIESTLAVPYELDVRTQRITYLGPQVEKLLGFSHEQWLEPDFWFDHIDARDREFVRNYHKSLPTGTNDYELEFRVIAPDGRSVWFQNIVHMVRQDDEPVIRKGFLINIDARKQVEEALRNLSARLINAQEEERSRIARELHDDFSQKLALLSLDLQQLTRDTDESPKAFNQHIQGLLDRVKGLSTNVHQLSHKLHPSTLIHLSLAKAIDGLCKEFTVLHNLQIDFMNRKVPDAVPNEVALCLFRIVQEALSNILKHSCARKARVELTRSKDGLKLCVRDQGVGFDVAAVDKKRGLGLISMEERLRLVGGKLTIKSSEAGGTQIEALVPLPDDGN